MATIQINSAQNVGINFALSGFGSRLGAWLLDAIIRLVYLYIADNVIDALYFGNGYSSNAITENLLVIKMLANFPVFFYYLLFELFFFGQSIGKRLLNIKVVSIDGYKPTVIQYLLRWVFRLVDLGFVSLTYLAIAGVSSGGLITVFLIPNVIAFFVYINSKKQQRLGDLVSGTVVIKLAPNTKLADTIFEQVSSNYTVQYKNVLKLNDRDINIINNAMQSFEKHGNANTVWLITHKLVQVLGINEEPNDAYKFLETVRKDYNYLTTK